MKNHFLLPQSFSQLGLISLMMVLNGFQLSAQYELIFQHTSDQGNWNQSWAIADDGQGNTYLAGSFENTITFGSFTLTSIPSDHGSYVTTGFIGKFNASANAWLWVKKITLIPSGQSDFVRSQFRDMVLDNAGNVYLTGSYAGTVAFDNITLTSTSQGAFKPTNDMFVAKYSTGGTVTWAKSFGSKNGSDEGIAIELDGAGNIYAAGYFANKTFICSSPGDAREKMDVYLIKLNNAGTSLWQKRYANNLSPCVNALWNYATDIAMDLTGNVHMCGNYAGTMSFGTGAGFSITSVGGSGDVFVAKINGSGSTIWVRSAGSSVLDNGEAVHVDGSGNVYTGGRINDNSFVTKYNSIGGLVWSVNPYPNSVSFPQATVTDINTYGNSLLINDSRIGFKTLSFADGALLTSDSILGNFITGRVSLGDVSNAGSGFVFATNVRCGSVNIENLTLTASCTNTCSVCSPFGDIGMVRNGSTPPLAAPQPIDDIYDGLTTATENSVLNIYPNPATDEVNIVFDRPVSSLQLTIYDQLGKQVWSQQMMEGSTTTSIKLDENRFGNGLYYIEAVSDGKVQTLRLVIAR